jgi:hypothetical protein
MTIAPTHSAATRSERIIHRMLLWWIILGLGGWDLLSLIGHFSNFFLIYYHIILICIGIPMWFYRHQLSRHLHQWSWPPFIKFSILGYGMVLLEEIVAAFANHLSEGFSPSLFLLRIGQFWAFNVLAFTGLILGWYWLLQRVPYSLQEYFILAGIFGLYSEKTYLFLVSNPIAFVLTAPLNIAVYGIILSPARLSISDIDKPRRRFSGPWRYPLAFFIPFIASILPVLILMILRSHIPELFPPTKFIP